MKRPNLATLAGSFAVLLLIAGPAAAEAPGMAELSTAAASEEESPWRARVVGEIGMGTGTLINNEYSGHPLVYSALTLTPIYRMSKLPFAPNLSVSQALQWEFSQPENISDRRFQWGDTSIALSSNSLYRESVTGISFGGTVAASLPISYRSINTNKITSTAASGRAMWGHGNFLAMVSAGATKHFYRYPTEVHEGEVAFDDGYQAVHCRAGQEVCMGGRYALNWSLTGGMMMAYRILPELSVTLDMAWTTGWRNQAPVDEFTSPNARVGSRTPDMTRALLDFSYTLTEELSLSAGAATFQPLLTRDNSAWRNPFYDGSPRNNFTSFYFDLVYSI